MLEKRAALISLRRQRPPPTPPNDPPWKNVFTDISLYDHFELPEHIFGKCHFGNVHEENWCLCPTPYKSTNPDWASPKELTILGPTGGRDL